MVDLVYGRGITDIVREIPLYVSIFKKFTGIKLFHTKPALYGSADIINVCNLHCSHCYWWLNRQDDTQDLSVEDWRETKSFCCHTGWRRTNYETRDYRRIL